MARLLHVRSIMRDADAERIPAAMDLMRRMLWVESLVVRFDGGSAEAAAVSELCRVGQAALVQEQGIKRLVCYLSIRALDESLLLLDRTAIGDAFQSLPGPSHNRSEHLCCAGCHSPAHCTGHPSCTAATPAPGQHLLSGPLMT